MDTKDLEILNPILLEGEEDEMDVDAAGDDLDLEKEEEEEEDEFGPIDDEEAGGVDLGDTDEEESL